MGCATDALPTDEPANAPDAPLSTDAAPSLTRTSGFALAEFEGYANPATGEFRIERVVDLNPLAQMAALHEGRDLRTIGQAFELVGPSTLPRSTPAPWCLGTGAIDGTPGSNPPDTFELYTDPSSIASALPENVVVDGVPPQCNVAGSDQSLYSVFGVFCATVRAMNFYSVPWNEVHAQIYLFNERTAGDQAPYAEGYGTSVTTTAGGVVLPQYVDLPEPGGEFGLWRYGTLAPDGGNEVSVTWTFRNYSDEYFTFRGRIVGTVAENCSTPDINEDCDPLDRGDDACRLYTTGEACTDHLDCESYSCVGGFCEDGCHEGLYGNACQFECPGGFANVCNGVGGCDDGRTGTGACACDAGFHGDACQFSCSDAAQNGAETGVDIGGPCPVPAGGPNEIYYNGYFYRTLDDVPPGAAFGTWTNNCQTTPLAIPAGYELAPYDAGVVADVIAVNDWSTHCIFFSDGVSYGTDNYSDGQHCGCSGTLCMSSPSANTWQVTSCARRILIRRSATISPVSCRAHKLLNPAATSGVYAIDPESDGSFVDVYCDMTTDGGGWTMVSSSSYPVDDLAQGYSSLLQLTNPGSTMPGVWGGMRSLIAGNSDIRFTCKQSVGSAYTVDLSFYNNGMYRDITAGPTDNDTCFEEGNGFGYTGPWTRRNNMTGASTSGPYGFGYLEGEDSCGDTGDFAVDYTDRGMDNTEVDGTDWGEDDGSAKCGSAYGGSSWHIFVRELP